jgi:hypothetical protein
MPSDSTPKPKVHVHFHLVCPPPPPRKPTVHTAQYNQLRPKQTPHTGAGRALIYCVARWPKIRPHNSKIAQKNLSGWAVGASATGCRPGKIFSKKGAWRTELFFQWDGFFHRTGRKELSSAGNKGPVPNRTGPLLRFVVRRAPARSGLRQWTAPPLPTPRVHTLLGMTSKHISLIFSRNSGCFLHSFILYRRRS